MIPGERTPKQWTLDCQLMERAKLSSRLWIAAISMSAWFVWKTACEGYLEVMHDWMNRPCELHPKYYTWTDHSQAVDSESRQSTSASFE